MSSRIGADGVEGLPGGVVEFPVLVAFAGEEGAGVAAAHGDDDVGGLDGFGGEDLRGVGGDVDADFGHGLDGDGVDLVGGFADPAERTSIRVAGEVAQVAGGHLGAAGVVDADEQDGGLGGRSCRVSLKLELVVALGCGGAGDQVAERAAAGLGEEERRAPSWGRCRRTCRTRCGRG